MNAARTEARTPRADRSRVRHVPGRGSARLLAAAAALAATFAGAPAHAAGPQAFGWIRLAHYSPNTPPVDVYLYPYQGRTADVVLHHVAYETASPYEAVAPGIYTVAMRTAGASATAAPVISTNVTVTAGDAYTVAGMGPFDALTLDVLHDQTQAPAGKADVKFVEASLRDPVVAVTAQGDTTATSIRFPSVTGYTTMDPGTQTLTLTTTGGSVNVQVDLQAATTHTLVVLDSAGTAPRLLDLTDAAGTAAAPRGGIQTGLGGTAPHPPGPMTDDVLWGAVLLAGAGGTLFAARRLRGGTT